MHPHHRAVVLDRRRFATPDVLDVVDVAVGRVSEADSSRGRRCGSLALDQPSKLRLRLPLRQADRCPGFADRTELALDLALATAKLRVVGAVAAAVFADEKRTCARRSSGVPILSLHGS